LPVRPPSWRVASAFCNRYIPAIGKGSPTGTKMRAETQSIVDEIKQSVGLLRRHL
jgi:hypothetical protein